MKQDEEDDVRAEQAFERTRRSIATLESKVLTALVDFSKQSHPEPGCSLPATDHKE